MFKTIIIIINNIAKKHLNKIIKLIFSIRHFQKSNTSKFIKLVSNKLKVIVIDYHLYHSKEKSF